MSFYVPLQTVADWQRLHRPEHWKDGCSAKQLATAWQQAAGFPAEVSAAFAASSIPVFRNVEFLAGFPEFCVDLPPSSRQPSQTDIMVLSRAGHDLVVIAVEGKTREPFSDYVRDWRRYDTKGKAERLVFLSRLLGLDGRDLDGVRYQLLHRTASALLTARRFGASRALVLVHSFSPTHDWFDDYSSFLQLFGVTASRGPVQSAGALDGTELYFLWVSGRP